ncbi:NAD-dependent epimerase/dehydratase family protein [Streptomyces sp. NPDC051940]|uniref:NAD-dependent epimerase/dehydratase family protein n=1 Tax=Streptomyces sp. NPDC051940 TaxID=3155675 RepID=UPI003448C9DE
MRLLILGGTEFVGRAVAEDALARGWEVTVFHRGRHAAPEGARDLIGDRTTADGLAALGATEEWDVVVDTWSAAPRVVRDSARLLADRAGRYAYVSTASVYAAPQPVGIDEGRPTVAGDPDAGEVGYAEAKRGGELAAVAAFGESRSLLLRAGLILGPYENIGRLPWWLTRIARGGDVLAPGPREQSVQYVDARDLAAFTLDASVAGRSGAYNVVSPPDFTTLGEILDTAVATANPSGARLAWTDPTRILDAGVQPWIQLPIWVPRGEDFDALMTLDTSHARNAGLRCRPVEATVRDTWRWLESIGGTAPQRPDRPVVGLDPELEAKVLSADAG